jgi:hypothetical protein
MPKLPKMPKMPKIMEFCLFVNKWRKPTSPMRSIAGAAKAGY